jgi:transcription-repair coupling factor (superfamily II helicase)
MARRGGILDFFPPDEPVGIRVEWFGDQIESLRRYDPESQRSLSNLQEIVVIPASEALPGRGPDASTALEALDTANLHPLAQSDLRRHLDHLRAGERFDGLEFYGPLLHPGGATLLDHVPADGWIACDSLDELLIAAEGLNGQAETLRAEQVSSGELPRDWPLSPLAPSSALMDGVGSHRSVMLGRSTADDAPLGRLFGMPPRFGGRIEEAVMEAARLSEEGKAVVVVSRQAPRIADMLSDLGLHTAPHASLPEPPGSGGVAVVHGILGAGWTMGAGTEEMIVLTDGELFGWRMPRRRRASRAAEASRAIDVFAEYLPGDLVVHIEHGIGVFRGLERVRVGDVDRDYLKLEYAHGDALFVPTHQADRVARYVGVGDIEPAVSRLGTADWERAKERAKKAVEDIAADLLTLYARREVARRAAFAPDSAWQAEMEAAFPYVETDDQIKAIDAVKRDMESERPMDRLVVGDVGFGKTEVAVRAAFKAVTNGKQVAVLVPTTILAQQHLDTFRDRLAAFPVRVDMLSRFRNRKEQKVTLEALASGEIDIVIGTQRLLSEDVRFRSLGLLIVDEEHRFGVKDKERLRTLKENVDTLTLTATPIPRTMHLALSGLRDLTTIDTPPDERLPVSTHVGVFDESVVKLALRRELARRGQVFYVYNRVQGIELVAHKVERLVPEARVEVAHGQMREDELAGAMLRFASGAVDVLVCTSIVESGLDIPNANTLIVERADRFGVAQLHQLRGRVGRGPQRAYAYFLYAPGATLSPEAASRLEAIAEAADLGAGFRLALRDLEIRGAGEILGARQHGQVAAIGLDLYTRLLAEAIKKLRADEPGPSDQVARELEAIDPGGLPTVDLPLDAYLPETYVPGPEERTRLYRRMAAADELGTVNDLSAELKDRFGRPPEPVSNLLAVVELRVLAHAARARGVSREGRYGTAHWAPAYELDREAFRSRLPAGARIGRHQISIPLEGPPSAWLPRMRALLEAAIEVHTQVPA